MIETQQEFTLRGKLKMARRKDLPIGHHICKNGGTKIIAADGQPIHICQPKVNQNCPAPPVLTSPVTQPNLLAPSSSAQINAGQKPCIGCKPKHTHTVGTRMQTQPKPVYTYVKHV